MSILVILPLTSKAKSVTLLSGKASFSIFADLIPILQALPEVPELVFVTGRSPARARPISFSWESFREFRSRIWFSSPNFSLHLGVPEGGHHVLEGRLRGVEGIVERPVVDIPAHELVDELLLDQKPLESRGIQGVLDPVNQDLDLFVEISRTPDPAVSLLEVHGPVRDVDMVGGQEPVLDVDPDPELLRGPHDHPDVAVVHLLEKLVPLLVRVEIVDDGDLVCRDALARSASS